MKAESSVKRSADTWREELEAVLAKFDISTESFDQLRSDAYEKHIAKRSLAELEGVYRELLGAKGDYSDIQAVCPRWSKGRKKWSGQLPDISTLRAIKRRILREHAINSLQRKEEYLKSVCHGLTGLP